MQFGVLWFDHHGLAPDAELCGGFDVELALEHHRELGAVHPRSLGNIRILQLVFQFQLFGLFNLTR